LLPENFAFLGVALLLSRTPYFLFFHSKLRRLKMEILTVIIGLGGAVAGSVKVINQEQ